MDLAQCQGTALPPGFALRQRIFLDMMALTGDKTSLLHFTAIF